MDPILSNLQVPCLCSPSDYCGSFMTFPAKCGFDIGALKQTGKSSSDGPEFVRFLQTWLCFGLLSDIGRACGVPFNTSDLIAEDDHGLQFVSYARVERYIWYWIGVEYHHSLDERREHHSIYLENLRCANQIVNTRSKTLSCLTTDNMEDIILLSIMVIVDYLFHNVSNIFNLPPSRLTIRWERSRILDKYLQSSGWCRGELPNLYTECSSITLLYLSTINRARSEKKHDNCTTEICLVNQIDIKTYTPSHATDCTNRQCKIIESPVEEVSNILILGRIPLVHVVETPNGPKIDTISFVIGDQDNMPSFTAISHVWSDGMGNPKANGLHTCQLRRIQRRVSALYPNTVTNCYFWLDTLCIPLDVKVRYLAITRMAKTYAHATQVLVLDTWLESWELLDDPRQLLARITKCDWNTRLWTYNELVLARECRFQLLCKSTTIDELKDHIQFTQNVRKVSDHLSLLSEADFASQEYAMILLKAITDVDQPWLEKMRHYSKLPHQHDENDEELRVFAIDFFRSFGDPRQIQETWRSMIAQLGSRFTSLSVDTSLRTHIAALITDPILGYGMEALFRMRGTFYGISMDRSNDIESGAPRQLHGFDAPPHVLFTDVGPGLQYRMTSRQEDETICMGAILGLDVSLILNSDTDHKKRDKGPATVSAKRMKVFLALLGKISPTILFCNVPRMQEVGFCWAPQTFMNSNISIRRGFGTFASITDNGLEVSFAGIRLPKLRLEDLCDKGQIHITYVDPETHESAKDAHPFRRSWAHAKLHLDFCTLKPHFDNSKPQDFVLIVDALHDRDGFLAAVVGEDKTALCIQYLLYASRTEGSKAKKMEYVKGLWFRRRSLRIV